MVLASPQIIPRVTDVVYGETVSVENSSNATYVWTTDGRQWVMKGGDVGWNDVFAECVSWALARKLGVNVPDGAIYVDETGSAHWLSHRIPSVRHWFPSAAGYLKNLAAVGAMLTLDVLVADEDRHEGNILLQPDPDEASLLAWAIDSGNAIVGQPADYCALEAGRPDPGKKHARGLPVKDLAPHALRAAALAAGWQRTFFTRLVKEAAVVVNEKEWVRVRDALFRRSQAATTLVTGYLSQLAHR